MLRAYVKADPLEDPKIIEDLSSRLKQQNILPFYTERNYKEIPGKEPFLYFRNPYIRFENEITALTFHHNNPDIPKLRTKNHEIISYSPVARGNCDFVFNKKITIAKPNYDPLPILIGIHSRPLYVKLTLNSIFHSLTSPKQQVYIVASNPNKECMEIILQALEEAPVYTRAVYTKNNLRYAFANFGSKFYGLKKFIHFEEDVILPENIEYHLPSWTMQFAYRSETTDLLALRVSEINYASEFLKSTLYTNKKLLQIPSNEIWHYTKPDENRINPIGGLGIVIDSKKMYKNFKYPDYCTNDHTIYYKSKNMCVVNIPVYHLGANQEMDYLTYMKQKRSKQEPLIKTQPGEDLLTGEKKNIDLSLDWEAYESLS